MASIRKKAFVVFAAMIMALFTYQPLTAFAADNYEVTFDSDSGVKAVNIYYTEGSYDTADEEGVSKTESKNGSVLFEILPKDGYQIEEMDIISDGDEELSDISTEEHPDLYMLSEINADVNVTITTSKIDTSDNTNTDEDNTDEDNTDENNTDEDNTDENNTDENNTDENTDNNDTDENNTGEDTTDEDNTDENTDNTDNNGDTSGGDNTTVTDVTVGNNETVISVESYSGYYDGKSHTVTATISESAKEAGTKILYSTVDPESAEFEAASDWKFTAPTFKDVSNNTVWVTAKNSKYTNIGVAQSYVNIKPETITVYNKKVRNYTGKEIKLILTEDDATGLVNNESLTLENAVISGEKAGTYDEVSEYEWSVVKANGDDSTGNYEIDVTGELVIKGAEGSTSSGETDKSDSSPKTGDEFPLWGLIALMGASGLTAGIVLGKRRKDRI